MLITKYNSPNFNVKRRSNKSITVIILHYTGMQSERESLNRLISKKSKVSCHYLISRKGRVFRLVKDNYIAWHAGKSMWGKMRSLNKNSIGIELVNKGHKYGYQSYSKNQITKLILLCKKLKKKYKIKNQFIVGHSDIAPNRKIDPGEKFPWRQLYEKGIGIYPEKTITKSKIKTANKDIIFFKNLHKIGYRYFDISKRAKKDRLVIKAFQQKFSPNKITGKIDLKLLKISHFLANN